MEHGLAWLGKARLGLARIDTFAFPAPPGGSRAIGCLAAGAPLGGKCARGTRRGLANLGMARSGKAWNRAGRGEARTGRARLGLERRGTWYGTVRLGLVRQGRAGCGAARNMARSGEALLG